MWEWYFSHRLGRPPTQTLYCLFSIRLFPFSPNPPVSLQLPPRWHFGFFTHIFQAGVLLAVKSIQIKQSSSKVWVFSTQRCHTRHFVTVCVGSDLWPFFQLTAGHGPSHLFLPRQLGCPLNKCDTGAVYAILFHNLVNLTEHGIFVFLYSLSYQLFSSLTNQWNVILIKWIFLHKIRKL